jgi:hypothetical protein
MIRQTIVDMVLNAYTLDECLLAEEALIRWLTAYPQDLGLHELAGQIGIVKSAALERQANGTSQTMAPPLLMPAAR